MRDDEDPRADLRHLELGRLLNDALELPAEQQADYLQSACDDPSLIREAMDLLAFDTDDETSFLEAPAAEILESLPAAFGADHPEKIGPYTLLDCIGEGGMGRVYRAVQHEPVERQVAIKVALQVRSGAEARRRFDLERKALGRLSHPNIARLYEAGSTEEGRPYVVMELVEGQKITQHSDLHSYSLDDRLRLFVDLCRGVQHAHQKQILHRDLKPANILVTEVDGKPVAKIIDFGIARALDLPVDHTFATGNRLLGTPHYMSPEALEPAEGHFLDTRTDIYSLGVVLYELITGVRPFLTPAGDLPRLLVEILEQDPRRPSTRLASLDDSIRYRLASSRGFDPESHLAALRGDLDWIVTKAMAKDRDQRYGSAGELGDEVERVLRHLPIEARPPSPLYRAGKWVRRHRARAVLGVAALCALLLAMVLTGLALNRAQRAEAQSRLDAEVSQRTLDFVLKLFESTGPDGSLNRQNTTAALLSQGIQSLRQSDLPPLARAKILDTLGQVHMDLGLFPLARELLTESLDIRRRELDANAPETLESARSLGSLEQRSGRPEVAEPLLQQALAGAEIRADTAPLQLADVLESMGNLRWSQDRFEQAQGLHQRALDLRLKHLGAEAREVALSHSNLGALHLSGDRLEQADLHLRRAHALLEAQLGPRHPQVAAVLGNLALALQRSGSVQEAERLQRRILGIQRETHGNDHPATATASQNLAGILMSLGSYDEAKRLYRSAWETRRRALGEDHPDTLGVLGKLGHLAWRMGNYPLAQGQLAETLRRRAARGETETPSIYRLRVNLAAALRDGGEPEKALEWLTDVLSRQLSGLGPEHPDTAVTRQQLGLTHFRLGELKKAESQLRQALDIQRRLVPVPGRTLAVTLFALGELLENQRPDQAKAHFEEALKLRQELLPESHPDRLLSEKRGLQ